MPGFFDDIIGAMQTNDKEGIVLTPKQLLDQQFGLPLRHFAQQYLFGSTGLRIGVFHSISGIPQSCKSPLLFDLMGHIAASPGEFGGLGGLGVLYEMEGKISPVLLNSILKQYGPDAVAHVNVVKAKTINVAFNHFSKVLIKNCQEKANYGIPIIAGFDSIGGSGADDTLKKVQTDGAVGKGFYDKSHFLKYFCENASALIGDLPMVIVCINQEKEKVASSPYGPQPKEMAKITGGVSQIYKDGWMVHADYGKLNSGMGKLITLRTLKTSFSDDRKIQVAFTWNAVGTDLNDAYNHHFDWAAATADVIANHEPVGTIRDVCNVSVAQESGRVTCPTLGLRSVPPEEFEAALFAEENRAVLDGLYAYLKIDKIKSIADYAEFMKARKAKGKGKDKPEEQQEETPEPAPKKPAKKKAAKKAAPAVAPFEGPVPEEEAASES